MDIKITSTGKVFYQVDNTLAAILIEALPGSFERVEPRPAPKPADLIPSWGINVTPMGYNYVTFSLCGRNENYDGPPSGLVNHFQKMGTVVPDHIVARYRPLWHPRPFEHPSVAAANAAEFDAIHSKERK
jgi:hypothetical protein